MINRFLIVINLYNIKGNYHIQEVQHNNTEESVIYHIRKYHDDLPLDLRMSYVCNNVAGFFYYYGKGNLTLVAAFLVKICMT